MRIECLTTFLDGRERFEKGDIFTIDDAKAMCFISNKWAKLAGDPTPAPDGAVAVDLQVQSAEHSLKGLLHG